MAYRSTPPLATLLTELLPFCAHWGPIRRLWLHTNKEKRKLGLRSPRYWLQYGFFARYQLLLLVILITFGLLATGPLRGMLDNLLTLSSWREIAVVTWLAVLTASLRPDRALGFVGRSHSSADLPHIFERFYHGDRAYTTHDPGLGLAITQEIAHPHTGVIIVASSLGQGTTFTVSLPVTS